MLHTMESESCRSSVEVSEDGSGGARSGPRGHTCGLGTKLGQRQAKGTFQVYNSGKVARRNSSVLITLVLPGGRAGWNSCAISSPNLDGFLLYGPALYYIFRTWIVVTLRL